MRRRAWGGVVALGAMLTLGTTTTASAAVEQLAQWRFDEAGGQRALDDGPLGLDGRLGTTDGADAGDPARVGGLSGGALRFGGRASVRLPDAPELAPATVSVEAVVRAARSPGPYAYLMSHGAQGCLAASYGLYAGRAGAASFYVFDGTSFVVSPSPSAVQVWDGRWHHLAGVFDGASVSLFLDGRRVGQPVPAPQRIAYRLTSDASYIGSYEGSCSRPFTGDMDLLRLWSGALPADQVATLAAAALQQSAAPGGPVAPADPGGRIPAPRGAAPRPRRPGPQRACVVRARGGALRAGRRAVLGVTVRFRGRALRRARVVARRAPAEVLATARTNRNGLARLRMRPARTGRLRILVPRRRACLPVVVRVRR